VRESKRSDEMLIAATHRKKKAESERRKIRVRACVRLKDASKRGAFCTNHYFGPNECRIGSYPYLFLVLEINLTNKTKKQFFYYSHICFIVLYCCIYFE
jgi:hypothetical protein